PPGEPKAAQAKGGAGKSKDKITVELWHYRDDFIQPMQRVRGGQDTNRTYSAVVHLADRHFVQLGDETLPTVSHNSMGDHGIGSNARPYRIEVGYDTTYADVYLVNTKDGSRKQVLTHHNGGLTFSPGGQYATFFDGRDWNVLTVATGAVT